MNRDLEWRPESCCCRLSGDVGPDGLQEKMDALAERVARVVKEEVIVVPYDVRWPVAFEEERRRLLDCLPHDQIRRVEHFGSTAVPGLSAKPIVDMLVEVTSLEETKRRIVPVLEAQKYEYFWRPSQGDDVPPFYAWFIKRDAEGKRTHHIHMVEAGFEHWDGLFFRDYLIECPDVAKRYADLKMNLAGAYRYDRVAYAEGKRAFIKAVTQQAKDCLENRGKK